MPRSGLRLAAASPALEMALGDANLYVRGNARELCSRPVHPYTEALLASIPLPMPGLEATREMPKGDLPDPANPPTGCRFHTRCPYSQPICAEEEPPLRPLDQAATHLGACHFQDELQLLGVEKFRQALPD